MLCINKRLYRTYRRYGCDRSNRRDRLKYYRRDRSYGTDWPNGADRTNRTDRADRTDWRRAGNPYRF